MAPKADVWRSDFRIGSWMAAFAAALIVAGGSPMVGAQDSALVFDGIDDIVTIAEPPAWPISTPTLTVEAWIKPSDTSGTSIGSIVRGGDGFTLALVYSDNTAVIFSIAIGPTGGPVTPTGSLVEGRWDHFAGTYDGTTVRIYQNGQFVDQWLHTAGGNVVIRDDVFIGFWPGVGGFPGDIDEVRIWNAVRTPAEIARWMTLPLTGEEPGLIGYWKFDEGAGQIVLDNCPLANQGVLGFTTAIEAEDPAWELQGVPFVAFFYDGFESGDTSGWAVTIP